MSELSTELEQLQVEETPEEEPKKKVTKAVKKSPGLDESNQVISDLKGENEKLKAFIEDLQDEIVRLQEGDTDNTPINPLNPDSDLVTVYVPFNAQGIQKLQGYDPIEGESYTYTTVKAAVKHEGQEHHTFEEFRIRLDSRVVVPRYVAEILGSRADVQEYVPEY